MVYAKRSKGQTLIVLLFVILIGVIVTAAAIIILAINAEATTKLSQGEVARQLAETGAEDALLQLLRDKTYAISDNIITVGEDTAHVTVTQGTPIIVDSLGVSGQINREIKVTVNFDANGVLNVVSWQEVYN